MTVITQVFLVVFLGLDNNLTRRVVCCDHREIEPHFLTFTLTPSCCILYLLDNWDFSNSTLTVARLLDPGAIQGDNNFLRIENNVCTTYHKFYNKGKPNNMKSIYSQIWQILLIMPPASLSLKEGKMLSMRQWQDGWVGSQIWSPSHLAAGQI